MREFTANELWAASMIFLVFGVVCGFILGWTFGERRRT